MYGALLGYTVVATSFELACSTDTHIVFVHPGILIFCIQISGGKFKVFNDT